MEHALLWSSCSLFIIGNCTVSVVKKKNDMLNHFLAAASCDLIFFFLCLYGNSQTFYLILLFPDLSFCPSLYDGSPVSSVVYSCIFRWVVSSYSVLVKHRCLLFTPCLISCNIILTIKGIMNHHTIVFCYFKKNILYILFTIFCVLKIFFIGDFF